MLKELNDSECVNTLKDLNLARSIDLSSEDAKEAFNEFLISASALISLDLSNNKFDADETTRIYTAFLTSASIEIIEEANLDGSANFETKDARKALTEFINSATNLKVHNLMRQNSPVEN